MIHHYSDNDHTTPALPGVEIWYHSHGFRRGEIHSGPNDPCWEGHSPGGACPGPGWYWWPCFPGCLPDVADPIGPFPSRAAAVADATVGPE